MEEKPVQSSAIPLLCNAIPACPEACDSTSPRNVAGQSLFLPLSVEDLQAKFTAHTATPKDASITSQGPLVTPDACPLLSLEDDRRVRFRDCDEEWLLTEEMSVASASVRCSEEASVAEASGARPYTACTNVGSGAYYASLGGRTRHCANCKHKGQGQQDFARSPQAHSYDTLQHDPSKDTSFDCTNESVSQEKAPLSPLVSRHCWWPTRRNGSGVDTAKQSSSHVTTQGSDMNARRCRRHTAPGALKMALIRSADGSLRRRPLHSPPCLTTSQPPKSCVRIQSEGVLTAVPMLSTYVNTGSLDSSTWSGTDYEGPPAHMSHAGPQTCIVPSRRLRTFSGPRVSSLVDSLPFGRRPRPYPSHISQPAALVDIAELEID